MPRTEMEVRKESIDRESRSETTQDYVAIDEGTFNVVEYS